MSATNSSRGYTYPTQENNPLEWRRVIDEIDADFTSTMLLLESMVIGCCPTAGDLTDEGSVALTDEGGTQLTVE